MTLRMLMYVGVPVALCLCVLVSQVSATVDATTAPSGGTSGGANVLIPDYNTSGTTYTTVDDGSMLGAVAYLSFNDDDDAWAEDLTTIYLTLANGGVGVDTRVDIYLECGLYAHVETVNAPGNPNNGSYRTAAMSEAIADLAFGTEQFSYTHGYDIASDTGGSLFGPYAYAFEDHSSPGNPRQTWFESGSGISTMFYYRLYSHVVLEAWRDGVDVGGRAEAHSVDGLLVAWDYSNPSNPVIALDSSSNQMILVLE